MQHLSGLGRQVFNSCVQTTFQTCSLFLGDDVFVSHAVEDRLSNAEFSHGSGVIASLDSFQDAFNVGTNYGTLTCIVLTTDFCLTCTFTGLFTVRHCLLPEI